MAQVTPAMIKELRERTQAGMADCKSALVECDADMEKSIEFLRKKGLARAAKKAGRVATEGAVISYIHGNNRIGVLLEVNCETDFVAANEDFKQFCRDVAMQIAAMSPEAVVREQIEPAMIEREKAVLREKALTEGKPEKILDKIVEGGLNKFYSEKALMEQSFVKDDKLTIALLQQSLVAKLGENIQVRRFVRFELGEGLQKKDENFAAEVAAQVAAAGN